MLLVYALADMDRLPPLPSDLFVVAYDQLAIIGRYIERQTAPADINLPDVVEDHQYVLSDLLADVPLIPLNFNCMLRDEAHASALLRQHGAQFLQPLAKLEQLRQFNFDFRIMPAAKEMSEVELELMLQRDLIEMQGRLRQEFASDVQYLSSHSAAEESYQERLIVLTRVEDVSALQSRLESLANPNGVVSCTCTFVGQARRLMHATVKAPKTDHVLAALEIMQIDRPILPADLKHAFQNHPNYLRPTAADDLGTILKMAELTQAYKLLRDVGRAQNRAHVGSSAARVYDFSPEKVGEIFMIEMKGPEKIAAD